MDRPVGVYRVMKPKPLLPSVALVVAALTIWAAVLPADAAGAAPAPRGSGPELATAGIAQVVPTMAVEPASGLVDGQTVRVTGAGFGAYVDAYECVSGAAGWEDCDRAVTATAATGPGGSVELEMSLHAVIDVPGQDAVDCRMPGRCVVLVTSESGNPAATATAPVGFDAGAPVPRPVLTVTPERDLVDGQAVQVEGQGFRPASHYVEVHQCGPAPAPEACRFIEGGYVPIEADGTISTEIPVLATLPTESGPIDCQTSAEPCLVVATESTVDAHWAGAATIRFDTHAPPLDAPQITVTPTSGLGDFTTMSVHGRNFSAGGTTWVRVCHAEDHQRCDFDSSEKPTPDTTNGFALELTAWSDFVVDPLNGQDEVSCRQAPGCVVVATDMDRDRSVTVPIEFGPPDAPRGRYLDPVFDNVEIERDVVYREAPDHQGNPVQLKLDVYRPAGDTATSRPVVVWMHGGWFISGGKQQMADYATDFARRGYVAVSIQYRLRPDMDIHDYAQLYDAMIDAHEDAAAAVEWLRGHTDDYGIDPDTIVAGGWSAGAVTATNLAYLPGQVGEPTRPIAAALPIAGWFVDPDDPNLPIPGPFARPDAGEPPAIVFHGTADQLLPVGSPRALCPLAHEASIACDYVGYDGDGHAILDGRRRDIVRRSTDFLAEHVLEPHGHLGNGTVSRASQ